ncbi:MAG: four helix bundle protein [Parcubacteria group bacterium]|nr:four helix bundle protein [Parcubacteria group bacterium]
MKTHRELIVWQRAIDLVGMIYTLTTKFPKSELYGLVSQMRRCAVSIPSNIAEGRQRGTKKDYTNFLRISSGSVAELETQLIISKKLKYGNEEFYNRVFELLTEIRKMLATMIRKMQSDS